LVEVGDTVRLALLAYRLDQSTFPLASAQFEVVDETGAPSGLATLSNDGHLTGVSPGVVTVRAGVPFSFATKGTCRVRIYPKITSGRRVLVVDAAHRRPLSQVVIWGCLDEQCAVPTEALTDQEGVAAFPALGSGPASFTAVSSTVRIDGRPAFERASILSTSSPDVYLPLRENPARANTGFNGSVGFSQVRTSGTYWLGFLATSIGDFPSMRMARLLGDPVFTSLEPIDQRVPLPGALVLYTSPALNIPNEVKPRSFGFGHAGERSAIAFATRGELAQLTALRAVELLSYVGAADYTLQTDVELTARLDVPDTADINGNGLCTNAQRCPAGSEDVPDWAGFTRVSMSPNRRLSRRTEVAVPRVPQVFDSVVVASLEFDLFRGALPTGFASKTPGAPGPDGNRPVEPLVVLSGVPFAGVETSSPGLWAVALSSRSTGESARLVRTNGTMPSSVSIAPLLPLPDPGSYALSTRSWTPAQPQWNALHAGGADLGRLELLGASVRHTVYFRIVANQGAVVVPRAPNGPGVDPGSEPTVPYDVAVIDLSSSTSVDEVFSFTGVNLSTWNVAIDGYSRIDR
jgi:hypothetical protein